MNRSGTHPDVLAAASRGMDRVRELLFSPLDPTRWLVLGFGAWLANLGEGGGGGMGWQNHATGNRRLGLAETWREATTWVDSNLAWLIPASLAILLLVAAVVVLVVWLSSHGRFIFLHQVATGRDEIALPWTNYAPEARALMGFRLALLVLTGLLTIPPAALGAWAIHLMARDEGLDLLRVLLAMAGVGTAMAVALSSFLIAKFTRDFVVPVMARDRRGCRAAWARVAGLLRGRPASTLAYLGFSLVLWVATTLLVMLVVVLTCCVAGCLLAIPFLGTVFLLPVPVFFRAFSLAFLGQLDPALDLLPPASPSDPRPAGSAPAAFG